MSCLRKLPGLLLVALLGVGAASTSGAATAKVRLVATVRPCAVVARGTSAQTLHAGTYAVAVVDRSATRYFRLRGPQVRKATSASFSGTAHWHLKLTSGQYHFSCGASARLRGAFTISP